VDNQDSKRRWGTEQRLEFIEFRLFWEGGVNRSDITSHFGVSVPQASNDLSQYKELAGDNIEYDASAKKYLPSAKFQPRFMKPSADRYLSQLKAVADGVVSRDETLIEHPPSADSMPIPGRRIEPSTLKAFLDSIRTNRSLEIHYQSMNPTRAEAIWRRITPHAFGHDGLRWHARAFCHIERKFKDFIVSRCRDTRRPDEPGARATDDKQWQTMFEVILRPNPALTHSQQQTIALDYQMTKGRAVIPIRCALLYYFEKRLRLDMDPSKDKPAEKPVVVENWAEFEAARDAAKA
jgi:predicted DNA-binding transcriptional regulator YafY